jgi:hypothetical protein
MAIIIASHMTVNMTAEGKTPDMGIHIMLMVQPPGMGIPPDIVARDIERLK